MYFICNTIVIYLHQRSITMKKALLVASASLVLLSGCATPTVVQSKQISDNQLSCAQLKTQISEAKEFEEKARKERRVTGKNVAAAVLFWPALLGTYSNTEEAINAAKDRQDHLISIYNAKNCR